MNAEPNNDAVRSFVESYAANIAAGNDAAVTAQFAEIFLAGGPSGVSAVRADDFARTLPKRRQLFAGIGCRSSALLAVEHRRLTGRFWLVTTQWLMSFEAGAAGGAEDIPSEVVFILDTGTEPFSIVMFLHGQDVAALRAKGRNPGAEAS